MKPTVRSHLNKLKFFSGLTPTIPKSRDKISLFVKKPYQAVCLISADFELAWAYRFSKSSGYSIEKTTQNGMQTRRNVPEIIRLCEQYNIPITWATVGHLFLNECKRTNGIAHPEIKRLAYFENEFWRFSSGDWFKDDPCTDYKTDPAWYCPDLIEQIIASPVEHEIGCHTFSHIDCRDEVCTDEVFNSEIDACKKAADKFNVTLKSFVHPGHQIGNLNNLYKHGFTSFRTDYGDTLGYPVRHSSGLWELKNSALIDYRSDWSLRYHINRYITVVKRAIKHGKVCVLWFHPSFHPAIVKQVLPKVFDYINENRDKIWVTTHNSYIDWLNQQK
jgi:peptidoglycan/xylan/chitin deacetylase (PgdA/CDA1 family)